MGKFQNTSTKVVVSVADEKDDRFGEGWEPYGTEPDEVESPEPEAKPAPSAPKKS